MQGDLPENDHIRNLLVQLLQAVGHHSATDTGDNLTELRETLLPLVRLARERLWEDVLDTLPDPLFVHDSDFRLLQANNAYAVESGLTKEALIGKPYFEVFPRREEPFPECVEALGRSETSPRSQPLQLEDGRTFIHRSFDVRGDKGEFLYGIHILHDTTQQAQTSARLRRINRIFSVLSDCTQIILHSRNEAELLSEFCQQLIHSGGFLLAWIGYTRDDEYRSVEPMAVAGNDDGYVASARISWAYNERGQGPTGRAIRTGSSVISRDIETDQQFTPWRKAAKEHGIASSLSIPLRIGEQIIGALNLYSAEVDAFDDEEVDLLNTLAENLSKAIDSHRVTAARTQDEQVMQLRLQAIESSRNGVLIAQPDEGRLSTVYTNPAFTKQTGYSAAEMLGKDPILLIRDDTAQSGLDTIQHALLSGSSETALLRSYHKDGAMFWNELHITPVRNDSGELSHWIAISNDVTEQVRYQKQLEYQANHDPVTGLPNRNLLRDRLEQALSYARRHQSKGAVLIVDIDGLRVINDSYGHSAGDTVLKEIGRRLSHASRNEDTVARMASDEFTIILTDVEHTEDITQVCDRMLEAVSRPLAVGHQTLTPAATIGISTFPGDASDADTLLRYANLALHRCKESGPRRYEYYQARMNIEVLQRLAMESQMRDGLKRGEFELYYQPQVDIHSRAINGFEALIRWNHPERGMISPATFIPLAEENGQILAIGKWVIESACNQIVQWQRLGLPPVTVSINISAKQLEQDDIIEQVRGILETSAAPPKLLVLELTESAVMSNSGQLGQRLQALRNLGVSLAMDDFGTGYSSLSYIHRFPFDELKIDQSFIRNLTSSPHDAAIVKATLAMTRSLKLHTVVEGVEDEAQLRYLERLDCDTIQGYYFSRPLPVDEATRLLQQNDPFFTSIDEITNSTPTLLIVDDEQSIAHALKRELHTERYNILYAESAEQAFQLLALHNIEVIISDHRMPGMQGTELLQRVSELYPDIIRLMLTGYADTETVTAAINQGHIHGFMHKPWERDELIEKVREAFRQYRRNTSLSGTDNPRSV